jgi:NADH-quinone oxidoreductase subunit C
MLYIFNRYSTVHRTVIYFDVAYNDEVETVVPVFPSADWFESEVYDMFGITFKGHPNLKRLLTPEGMKGFPLLKSWNPEEE